jgi:hypothetical protein
MKDEKIREREEKKKVPLLTWTDGWGAGNYDWNTVQMEQNGRG